MNEPVQNTASAPHKILTWSEMLPFWSRDALRRIVTNGACNDTDVKELFNLVVSDISGYSFPSHIVSPNPLSFEHLPPVPGDEQSVNLVSISNLKFVNRLPSDQTIPLGTGKGLTLVYGNNGSGKSGYARVLKKSCRARGSAQDIQPDAYSSVEAEPASAIIKYSIGNSEQSYDWVDDYSSEDNLSNVFVFDTLVSDNYLMSDDSASFTPFGLDILPKLVSVFDQIQKMILNEIESIETANEKLSKQWVYSDQTEVGKILSKLTYNTDRKKLEKLSDFTDDMKRKKSEIDNALKSDPQKLINITEAAIKRLKDFSGNLSGIMNVVEKGNIEAVLNALKEYENVLKLNKTTSENKFKFSLLNGVGSKEWKDLWDKAADYSNQKAYLSIKFPNVGKDALCVLCQNPIDENSKKRFLSFHTDINDASQTTLNSKLSILKKYSDNYVLFTDINSELSKVKADLKIYLTDEEFTTVENSVKLLSEQFTSIKQIVDNKEFKEIKTVDVLFKSLIDNTIAKFNERLAIEKSASNPEERTKYINQLAELVDKEWLSFNTSDVIKFLDNLRKINELEDKKTETKTKNISDFTTELTNIFVTEKFCNAFESELQKLGLRSIKVKLEKKRSRKAITEFGLKVVNADNCKVKDIASEGEQRCIALACYLAELSQSSHNSALVFDDPVSSLDHQFRSRIATRLVEESFARQVIIFTHDIAFLHDIQSVSDDKNSRIEIGYLEWFNNIPGYYRKGLPWDSMRPEQRLDELEKTANLLSKTEEPFHSENNIFEIRSLYSKLSATIERIVEAVIFNDVVGRFRGQIKLGNMRNVIGFSFDEHDEIMRLSKRCSDVTERHDSAVSYQNIVPSVDEFKQDVADTKKILLSIRQRQKPVKR